MENLDISVNDLRTMDQIVQYCRTIQERFSTSPHLQPDRQRYRKTLIDICRRCRDWTCPEGCEVKKAYRATL